MKGTHCQQEHNKLFHQSWQQQSGFAVLFPPAARRERNPDANAVLCSCMPLKKRRSSDGLYFSRMSYISQFVPDFCARLRQQFQENTLQPMPTFELFAFGASSAKVSDERGSGASFSAPPPS